MASAFNICSLSQSWSSTIHLTWLVIVTATSLALGLIANVSLLLAMTERLPMRIADPVSLLGWYSASSMLAISAIVLSKHFQSPVQAGPTFTQAYYYGIIAAGIYFCVAALMTITNYSAYTGYHTRYFKLTEKQCTLMLQTIAFLIYLLGGAAAYSRIEGWNFLDAVYWADFTLLTVGIGNISPMTHLGRSLLFPYATGGIMAMGLLVQSIRSLVLQKGAQRFTARATEKERERVVKRMRTGRSNSRLVSGTEDQGQGRQKQEFHLMRKVQRQAFQKSRWLFFLTSAGAWSSLWVIGAVIFWRTEQSQKWSFFESLYFCFVSLMTIGYGELYPQSNSGKPLYVFWSLLGIPIITILVSSMEDTIAREVRELTLGIGAITILPRETGGEEPRTWNCFNFVKGNRAGKEANNLNGGRHPPPGSGSRSRWPEERNDEHAEGSSQMNSFCGHHNLAGIEEAGAGAINLCSHPICVAYSIGKTIRRVMIARRASPTDQYTYEEWAWFLTLMKESDSGENDHAYAMLGTQSDNEHSRSRQGQDADIPYNGELCHWLGSRSPLQSGKDEAEWVLEHLCLAQERILKKESLCQVL